MATYDNIPLTWNDPAFSGVTNSGRVSLENGGTLSDRSITDTSGEAAVGGGGSFTIDHVRIDAREGVRIGGSGNITISNSYLESTGQGADHADTIQIYTPGATGNVTITNTTIVAHNTSATAGMFVADGWSGTLTYDNVVFQGGPYGLRIAADEGDITVSLRDVYFVGPFAYDDFLIQEINSDIHITRWENVRYATIVNGELVPGELILPPFPVEGGGAPTTTTITTLESTIEASASNSASRQPNNEGQFLSLTAAYVYLGLGVPTISGYNSLISNVNATNFGGGASGAVFNIENMFVNSFASLYRFNTDALSSFDRMVGGGQSLQAQLTLVYNSVIESTEQTSAGLNYFISQSSFYLRLASDLGLTGNGAALVGAAALVNIAVHSDSRGLGNSVNDLRAAISNGTAVIPTSGGFTLIETADGTAFDFDDGRAGNSATATASVSQASEHLLDQIAPLVGTTNVADFHA